MSLKKAFLVLIYLQRLIATDFFKKNERITLDLIKEGKLVKSLFRTIQNDCALTSGNFEIQIRKN